MLHSYRRNKSLRLAVILSTIAIFPAAVAFAAGRPPTPDIIIGEFEGSTWNGWAAQGDAFGTGPAIGQKVRQLEIEGARGNGVASSERDGDVPVGLLMSPFFTVKRKYLSFVIGGGNYEHTTCLNLIVGGKVVRSATGANSDRLMPASWDISGFLGKPAQIQIMDEARGNWGHINMDHIVETDHPERMPVVTQPLYQETFRPQFHFTARQWTENRLNPGMREEGWCNDLNGLVYYDGEYHLFAQRWAKCWIHAVSRDLVHWTELPPAFWEESEGSGVQSGNCVVDYGNTSGLSPDKKNPPMVAFWSRFDNKSQCISYSLDHGRTWKLYEHNPTFIFPERDPNVFWYAPGKHWVMTMYGDGQYHIFTSKNLLEWHNENNPIPNSFECPDFFELPVDGDKAHTKWVLIRGNGKYSIGSFDGTKFTEETPQFDTDGGPNFYATQSWGNTNTGDGRRIQAAWMRGGVYPDMPFNQQVTFPRELALRTTPDGLRIFREPIREIESLHKHEDRWTNKTLAAGETWDLKQPGDLFHIKMNVKIPEGATLTLNVRGVPVVLSHAAIACQTDPQPVRGELTSVELLIDRTSIEVFANHGEASTSTCFLPNDSGLSFKTVNGAVSLSEILIFQLKPAWRQESRFDVAKEHAHPVP